MNTELFQKEVWRVICEMGDYFSRLGGAARPWNFLESDIPIYVICYLLKEYDCNFPFDSYVNSDLAHPKRNEIKGLIEKVNAILSDLKIEKSSINLLCESWDFYNEKLKINDKSNSWNELQKHIESYK